MPLTLEQIEQYRKIVEAEGGDPPDPNELNEYMVRIVLAQDLVQSKCPGRSLTKLSLKKLNILFPPK